MSKTLRIFAEVYNSRKMCDPETKKGIEKHMKQLQSNPLVHKHSDDIWSTLNEEDRARLLDI
jgi:hypothetical protein